MNMIDSVGGFFGKKEDCIVVDGCVCERVFSSFLFLHVSVNLVFCPFMQDYVDIVVEGFVGDRASQFVSGADNALHR